MPVSRRELACVAAILALASILRFVNLPGRGGWGSDQGDQMLDVWRVLQTGHLPQVGPLSSIGTFHHGALTYDLWLLPSWLGHGDPTWVVGQTALLGVATVAIVWWVARGIGGSTAGLIAAYVAAISTALIGYSIYVWNPTLLEPGAALALLGTWQAWRTRNPRWWLVAAIGLDVVAQAHIAGPFLAIPFAGVYVLALRRSAGARGQVRRHLLWGLAAVAFVAVTYLPYLIYEVNGNFAETRAVLSYLTSPSDEARLAPPLAILLSYTRFISWPTTGWPLVQLSSGFPVALLVAAGMSAAFAWQFAALRRERRAARAAEPPSAPGLPPLEDRWQGFLLVVGSLLVVVVAGGLGLKDLSHVQRLPTEQYHAWADPLALVAVGLALGALWRLAGPTGAPRLPQALVGAALVLLTLWNAANWPPLDAGDGGYPAARNAVTRLEADLNGSTVSLVSLFPPEDTNAYVYPLTLDGVTPVAPGRAQVLVLYCDAFFTNGCEGAAQSAWLAVNELPPTVTLIDRIPAGPDRTLSVYRLP